MPKFDPNPSHTKKGKNLQIVRVNGKSLLTAGHSYGLQIMTITLITLE